MWTRELLVRQPLEVAFDRHRDSTCVVFFFFGHCEIHCVYSAGTGIQKFHLKLPMLAPVNLALIVLAIFTRSL